MLFRSARGVAASVAAVFAVELLVFVAVADLFGLLAASLGSLIASIVGMRLLVLVAPNAITRSFQDLAFPGMLTGVIGSVLFVGPVRSLLAPSLGSRLSGLLPAEALGGRSFMYRRAHDRDVVDATATVKDPARPPASSAGRAQVNPYVHELP